MAALDVQALAREGFVVVRDAVPPDLIDALLSVICQEFEIDLHDEKSWYGPPARLPLWGHQAQWDARQHPDLHEVFAAAYDNERLWVSLDFPLYKPPHRPDDSADGGEALPIHWDVDPRDRHLLQGMLYLVDSPEKRGAFRCVPALFQDRAAWFERHADADLSHIDVEDNDIVSVACQAGDLLLWDSRLPHGNGRNRDSSPRITQAVTMQPPGFWGESAEDRIVLWQTGRPNPHYADEPGFDRVEPWPPATLTPLGRRLLGLDEWPEPPRAATQT
jgi:Phytanoyl-CoA dioxygenase (PhyH)